MSGRRRVLPVERRVREDRDRRLHAARTRRRRGTPRADDSGRRIRVDEGSFEEPHVELLAQNAAHRHIEALLGQVTGGHQVEDELGAGLATELVGAGIQHLLDALARREVFDAPGTCGEGLAEDEPVVDQPEVGAHQPVEAVPLSQAGP